MSDAIHTIPKEARSYQGRRAGIVTRVGANAIDLLVIVLLLVVVYTGWSATLFLIRGDTFEFPTPSFELVYLIGAVILWAYFASAWATTGRTYGNHLLGLRVVNRRGAPLRPVLAAVRSLACVVFPVGLFWCAVSRENRSIQDLIVRTSVIYDWDVHPRSRRTDALT